jgi:hypothetical protein
MEFNLYHLLNLIFDDFLHFPFIIFNYRIFLMNFYSLTCFHIITNILYYFMKFIFLAPIIIMQLIIFIKPVDFHIINLIIEIIAGLVIFVSHLIKFIDHM